MKNERNYYEVLFWKKEENQTENEAMQGDFETRKFGSKKRALAWYEKHKNDTNKCGFWVTYREGESGSVLDDLIY